MEEPPLTILYRDDHLIAIDKPPGLLVHRSMIDRHETRFAIQLLRDQIGQRVYPLHRLDKPTSGVLLFSLDSDTARLMGEQFMGREIDKHYLTVVRGYSDEQGHINHPLKEQYDKMVDGKVRQEKEAQSAITDYRRLATVELPHRVDRYPTSRYSLLALTPHTGRKHQLRRHMKHIDHPIIGDTTHGKSCHNRLFAEEFDCSRLLLAATELHFPHPYRDERCRVVAPVNGPFAALVDRFGWQQALPPEWRPTPASR